MRVALVRTYQRMMFDEIAHPLGIMALDAYLRTKGYDDIHLADMRLEKETPAQLVQRIIALEPDVVGLSCLSIERESIHEITRLFKTQAPHIVTVLGGPYATASSRTIMRDATVDYVVVGEGEISFHELLESLRTGGDLAEVKGILYRDDGEVRETPPRPTIQDLDALPFPSWDRIDMEAYERLAAIDRLTVGRWAVFYTSRGCPFKCTYCHDVFGKKFRSRSPQRVIDEMELLIERYGVRTFHIFDDIFNFNKQRVLEICRLIVEKGWDIDLYFPNGVRADMMDLEILEALRAAGTYRVSYAIETASPRVQKSIRKHLKLDKVKKLIDDTDEMGILVHGFFMLGFPGETREEVMSTVQFALKSRLHTAGFFLVSPFEGSPLGDSYLDPAREFHGEDWQYYDNPHSLSELPADEIKRIQRAAYLRFHLDPRRLFRLFWLLPRKRIVFRFAWYFLRLVTRGFKIRGAGQEKIEPRSAAPLPVPTRAGVALVSIYEAASHGLNVLQV